MISHIPVQVLINPVVYSYWQLLLLLPASCDIYISRVTCAQSTNNYITSVCVCIVCDATGPVLVKL